jgi:acyl-CoA thioester hydrolase
MSLFRFFVPVEIRYSDLDPQGHVNNARYFSYFEQARIAYIQGLGLWDGQSWLDIGIILAEAKATFYKPLLYRTAIQVGVRTARLGRKSLDMVYTLQDRTSQVEIASGMSILVMYAYREKRSIAIPEDWRQAILEFEEPNSVEVK